MFNKIKKSNKRNLEAKLNFKDKAYSIHGNKYDYSLIDYKNNSTKIKIMCIKHGMFLQSPNNHLKGQNCPKCAKKIT